MMTQGGKKSRDTSDHGFDTNIGMEAFQTRQQSIMNEWPVIFLAFLFLFSFKEWGFLSRRSWRSFASWGGRDGYWTNNGHAEERRKVRNMENTLKRSASAELFRKGIKNRFFLFPLRKKKRVKKIAYENITGLGAWFPMFLLHILLSSFISACHGDGNIPRKWGKGEILSGSGPFFLTACLRRDSKNFLPGLGSWGACARWCLFFLELEAIVVRDNRPEPGKSSRFAHDVVCEKKGGRVLEMGD